MAFLTIDVGSSELKVSCYSEDGTSLAAAQSEIGGAEIDGCRAELNPERLWQTVAKAIAAVCSQVRVPLRGASISSHGESFVALDRQGRALGNIILNMDTRAEQEAEEFAEALGRESLYQQVGLTPHPMYTIVKIAWLRKNEPRRFAEAARFVCIEDYILHRLGMTPVMGSPLAGRTMAFDLHTNQWAERVLHFAGISSDRLSRVQPSGTVVGTAGSKIAGELGLPPGLVWCSGAHDQAFCVVGAGADSPGDVADGTGTFECMSIPTTEPLVTSTTMAANLPCERNSISDQFLTLAYGPGGIAVKWLRNVLGSGDAAQRPDLSYSRMTADLPAEPTGLFFFPYLVGTGTPWMDPHARGAIVGMDISMDAKHLAKAAMEGVCYQMRWNLEILQSIGIPMKRFCAVGGGSKSDAWLQLKADIFERPVIAVPGEATSLGAAICAAVGTGLYRDWHEAIAAMVKPGKTFEPRAAAQSRYRELFQQYKELGNRLFGHSTPAAAARPEARRSQI